MPNPAPSLSKISKIQAKFLYRGFPDACDTDLFPSISLQVAIPRSVEHNSPRSMLRSPILFRFEHDEGKEGHKAGK